MLGLGAVNVDRVCVRDWHHEHGSVASLAVVVPVFAFALASSIASSIASVGASIRVSGDRLEVGEDGIPLGLARVVGS